MDYQAALRQKDAELEERAGMLLKCRAAIEQLQEELGSCRRQNEALKKAGEQQAQQLQDTEQHLRLVEGELESKTKECTDLLGESLSTKRRLQELQDGLSTARDSHASQLGGLQSRTQELERQLAAARAEAQAAQQAAAKQQALAAEREGVVQRQAGQLAQLEQSCVQLQASLAALGADHAELARQKAAAVEAAAATAARAEGEASELRSKLAGEVAGRQRADVVAAEAQAALERERERTAADAQAWDRRLQALQEEWAAKLERYESSWAAKYEALRAESEREAEESRREWTRKYYLTEGEWFKKLQAANQDWASKLEGVGREWMQRYDADRAKWEEERAALQRSCEERVHSAEATAAAAAEEARQQHKKKVAALEAKVAADINTLERMWSQRMEAALAASEQDRQAAQRSWEAASSDRQALAAQELAEARQAGQAAVAEAQAGWAGRLAAEEKRWLQERHSLERQWANKLHAAERAASESQAALRSQIEARLAAVAQRVAEMAQREARREAKRSELLRQVGELRAASESEHRKRGELEAALREASSIFKRELQDKNEQLEMLRRELRHVRTLEPLSLDYSGVDLSGAAAAGRICRSACRLAHCLGRPASAGAATYGRPLSPIFVGPNTFVGSEGAVSPRVLSPVRPSSAAARAARAAEKEAAALRSARLGYQQALLEQQEERTALLRSINDALKEKTPTLELAGNARPRGKWRLGVASKLQNVVHSTPSSPIRGGGSPSHFSPASHPHRPRSAAATLAQPQPAEAKATCVTWEQSCRSPGGEGLTNASREGLGTLAGAVDAAAIATQGGAQDLKNWHEQLASRVGRAVSRLQQLTSSDTQ